MRTPPARDRARARRNLDSFQKECSTVFKGQSNRRTARQESKPGKQSKRSVGITSRDGSDQTDGSSDFKHAGQGEFPDRQPDSYPISEDENSRDRDLPDRIRRPYAGKKLPSAKKRKGGERSDEVSRAVAQKKPRSVETVIPETDDTDGENRQQTSPEHGLAIAVGNDVTEKGVNVPMSGPFLKSYVGRISAQFASSVSDQLGDIAKKIDSLVAQVASLERDVSDLRALASCNSVIASKGSQEKGVKVLKRLLDSETPFIEVAFNNVVQSKVLSMCLCHLFVAKFKDESDRILDRAAHSLLALLFGLQKDKSKISYKEGEGRLHADFRYMYSLSMIYHVQHNRSGQFVGENEVSSRNDHSQDSGAPGGGALKISDSSHGRVSANSVIAKIRHCPVQPRWLRLGFIKVGDLMKARQYAESASVSREKNSKQAPNDRDIAVHGCRKLYTLVTTSFHRRRSGSRVQFFEDLGYLAADWSCLNNDVHKSSLTVSWAHEEGKDFDRTLSSVPFVRKISNNDENTRNWNVKVWTDFRDDARDMIVLISHDVIVVQGETVSKSKDRGTIRKIHRALNLMDVAAGFIVRYVQLPSIEEFIGLCENSIKAIFMVAVAFRKIVECLIWDPLAEVSAIKCDVLPVDRLQPPPSVQERSVNSRLLRMTQSQFDELNLPSTAFERRTNASVPDRDETVGHEAGSGGQEIDPSQGLEICI